VNPTPSRGTLAARIAPGLPALLNYQRADLPHDLVAGLSVAAVALPVGVAYAQLAGFNPAIGLYSSILPLVAYALFGTSRQLIVGPDSATCALVAAIIAPLAGGDEKLYLALSVALALLAGLLSIGASFLKLGALADFLSKPILVGFLNGISLSIILGQLGKLFGFEITRGGIVPRLLEFISKLNLTHWPTLAVGAASFAVLLVSPRFFKRLPAALVVMALAAVVVKVLGLEAQGVHTIGEVPAGLPALRLPVFPMEHLPELLAGAAGVALISFSSMMLTARSFASKNHYDIDPDREFAALGASNIASAFSQGFAISGADSRTAMNDSSGGRTQVAGLVAAGTVALVLVFLTGPMRYVPMAALAAVLVKAGHSLMDLRALRLFFRMDKRELAISILATLGVVAVGAVQAILVAVILALLRFVQITARPKVEILGEVKGMPGLHAVSRHAEATTIPGLLLFRFNGPIVFFNAPYFKREVLAAVEAAGPGLRWFVLDMIPVSQVDLTGMYAGQEVFAAVRARGVAVVMAGRNTEWDAWASARNVDFTKMEGHQYPTMRAAIRAFRGEGETEDVATSE
jgi:high affinity sulfate transporter 1